MKKLRRILLFGCGIASLCLVLICCSPAPKAPKAVTLNISSAISLNKTLQDIQKIYAQEKPNVTINYNFAASKTIQQEIEQGANVDIFFSASPKPMDVLESKGFLLPDARKNLVNGQMALITRKNATGIKDFKDLTKNQVKKVVLGNPKILQIGNYAQEILENIGILAKVKSKFIFGDTVNQVIANVETGKADAGILFVTDALNSNKVDIVALAPSQLHSPIIYQIAVLKNSKNIPEAKEFSQFLFSEEAKAVFVKYRFITTNLNNSNP